MTPHFRSSPFGILTALLAAAILAATMVLSATGSAALTAETKAGHEVPPAPEQLGPTPVPGEAMTAAVFLPLVSNSSKNHVAAHGDNFSGVATSGYDSGSGSLDLPPTPNNHTFVVDTAEYLDRYLARESLPGGRLTFTIPITSPNCTAFCHCYRHRQVEFWRIGLHGCQKETGALLLAATAYI